MSRKSSALKPLTPPDPKQCQAMKPNGHTFMTLGGVPGHERCTKKPAVIATEKTPGKDGRRGSMSLCIACHLVMMEQLGPDFAAYKEI